MKRLTKLIIKTLGVGIVAGLTSMSCLNARATDQNGTVAAYTANAKANSCSTCCFPSSAGWNKCIQITNNFVGPLATNVYVGMITNLYGHTNLVATTCDAANGTNLQTGIMIQNLYFTTTFVCGTNNPNCLVSTNLSTADMVMSTSTNTAVYRITVYYKSSTLGGLTNISVDYNYTN